MPQVPVAAIKDRTTRLEEKSRNVRSRWLARHTGETIVAILEGSGPRDGRARTPHFAQVNLHGLVHRQDLRSKLQPGDTVAARVTGQDGQRLMAEALT